MTKLSEVVAYLNLLEKNVPLETASVAHDTLMPILHTISSHQIQFESLTQRLTDQYNLTLDILDRFDSTIDSIRSRLLDIVAQQEPLYYAQSTELYEQQFKNDQIQFEFDRRLAYDAPPGLFTDRGQLVNSILDCKFNVSEEAKTFITARLLPHSTWQHPSMIIRPGRENWIQDLVGADPLYLVDQYAELLEPALLRYNNNYRNRLRKYLVNEANSDYLELLPDSQFKFCLVYNFFNYKPLPIIKNYLCEIWKKLKPGGVVAMTINNCDRAAAVSLVERYTTFYTPGKAVIEYAQSLGFQLINHYNIDLACSWFEFQKPGTLTTLRGGQSLAKIVYK
jgi:SAM-dependent methyltransferase